MPKRIPEVDRYIAKSSPFAQPIMNHLRDLVHQTCPEAVEVIKWGFPNFEYKGNLCSMAAFKEHCTFGFWRGIELPDPEGLLERIGKTAMGNLGKLKKIEDLPKQI
ncbi:MAG TPA: DUF1801 domain-containing protein, partial [Flavobacteriales bacterium]|nr:DUF1801 domain-containing protein [Flavobacteriales bacterium]